jgi:hypothetical protein
MATKENIAETAVAKFEAKPSAGEAQNLLRIAKIFSSKSLTKFAEQLGKAKKIYDFAMSKAKVSEGAANKVVLQNTVISTNSKLPLSLEEFYEKIVLSLADLDKRFDLRIKESNNLAQNKAATEANALVYDEYLAASNDLLREINDHYAKNPSLYSKTDEVSLKYISAIAAQKGTVESNINKCTTYRDTYRRAIIDTESRFNSKLLKDNNANNLSGNPDDYNDPELPEKHYNSSRSASPFNDVVNGITTPTIPTSSDNDYRDFSDVPLVSDGMTSDDIVQGSDIGNCYLMATLSSIVRNTEYRNMLRNNIVEIHPNLYEVTFYVRTLDEAGNPTPRLPKAVRVDTDFPVDANGNVRYSQIRGDIWVQVIEKAYAKEFGGFDDIGGDTGIGSIAAFTNREPILYSVKIIKNDEAEKTAFIRQMQRANPIMVFNTDITVPNGENSITLSDGQIIFPKHAYSFVSYSTQTGIIQLRNPHGENHLSINFEIFEKYFTNVKSL